MQRPVKFGHNLTTVDADRRLNVSNPQRGGDEKGGEPEHRSQNIRTHDRLATPTSPGSYMDDLSGVPKLADNLEATWSRFAFENLMSDHRSCSAGQFGAC